MKYDYVIVGAGIAGCVCAERLSHHGTVLVVEQGGRVGGLCADNIQVYRPAYMQLCGPHIFHTNLFRVCDYLYSFAQFNQYKHRVQCKTASGKLALWDLSTQMTMGCRVIH